MKFIFCLFSSLVVESNADQNNITSLVQSHIPNFSLHRVSTCELTYTVPLYEVDHFPDLLHAIEDAIQNGSHGIQTYGVSMTTLEEVFLKIGEQTFCCFIEVTTSLIYIGCIHI
jgi:hypothetical protein